MTVLVLANEATAARRRVYFHLVDATDGITPETGEAAGQPQVSTNGGAWTNTGIGTLSAIGNGRYYADLTQALVTTAGNAIETRFKSANTAECPGDSVRVVAFDPYNATNLGISALPSADADAAGGLPISDAGGLDMDAILVDTNSLNDTKVPQTLNLTASGNIGIDWANVENATNATNLSATTINLCNTITTYTGNTVQTADVATLITTVGAAGVGLTAVALADGTSDAVIADAVWNAATVTYGGAGSYGLVIETNLDAVVSGCNTVVPDAAGTAAGLHATTDALVSAASIAAAVWNAATATYGTAGSYGLLVETNLDAAVSGCNTVVPDVAGTAAALHATTDGLITTADTAIDAVATTIGVAGAGLTDLGGMSTAMKAEIQTEANAACVDVVNVDALVAGVAVAEALRRIGGAVCGELSGAGLGTETVKDWADSANTIVYIVDGSGNRSTVTFN